MTSSGLWAYPNTKIQFFWIYCVPLVYMSKIYRNDETKIFLIFFDEKIHIWAHLDYFKSVFSLFWIWLGFYSGFLNFLFYIFWSLLPIMLNITIFISIQMIYLIYMKYFKKLLKFLELQEWKKSIIEKKIFSLRNFKSTGKSPLFEIIFL